jgi:heterodisulfide reductase subunit D
MELVMEKLKKSRAFYCLECGKCTAVCPIATFNKGYSPRRMLAEGLFYGARDLLSDRQLWSCLTCQLCSQRCPVDVRYSEYMRDVRAEAYKAGHWGNPSHGGALLHIMEMAASPGLKQNRTGWITEDLKVKQKGEFLYFVGCLPYFQDFFAKDFTFEPVSIARDAVKVLNRIGIEPVVLENERCCGHDLYWLGQLEKFDELGRLNMKDIEESGAKTVITACPECALSLKRLYPERLGKAGYEVLHISELLARSMDKLIFKELNMEVTFQDPCRLGRYLGVYDPPRQVLSSIPGLKLHEMRRNRRGSICCGTTNWMNCDASSGQIQRSRLKEAGETGAKTLVTACPKCQIHFRCAACGEQEEKSDLLVSDFVNIVASALEG